MFGDPSQFDINAMRCDRSSLFESISEHPDHEEQNVKISFVSSYCDQIVQAVNKWLVTLSDVCTLF